MTEFNKGDLIYYKNPDKEQLEYIFTIGKDIFTTKSFESPKEAANHKKAICLITDSYLTKGEIISLGEKNGSFIYIKEKDCWTPWYLLAPVPNCNQVKEKTIIQEEDSNIQDGEKCNLCNQIKDNKIIDTGRHNCMVCNMPIGSYTDIFKPRDIVTCMEESESLNIYKGKQYKAKKYYPKGNELTERELYIVNNENPLCADRFRYATEKEINKYYKENNKESISEPREEPEIRLNSEILGTYKHRLNNRFMTITEKDNNYEVLTQSAGSKSDGCFRDVHNYKWEGPNKNWIKQPKWKPKSQIRATHYWDPYGLGN